ncbi:class F sortase [Micrococcus sp.]|uniref:class F sortase n=1 Tax=Micrococcus sp. TaxID=1271 RepID=UPI002A915A91|nr:class F sortase [Micrococcus sp.]
MLAPSRPLRVRIPSVGVDSELMELGIQEDGTVEVPPPGPGSPAGWYRHSPTPGARGPAVLLGHSNNRGDGVFDRLPALTPGEVVQVDRADGSTAVFVVDRAEDYGKDGFPTEQVYGNTLGAELRLITCGDYDPWTGRWNANHVVYASLAG